MEIASQPMPSPSQRKAWRKKILLTIGASFAALVVGFFVIVFAIAYIEVRAVHAACRNDWHQCKSNTELVEFWDGIDDARAACRAAAYDMAKYGTPDLPWSAFRTYHPNQDPQTLGKALLYETEARVRNVFGTMKKTTLVCHDNLAEKKVVDLYDDFE
jgi:hypothetical protein